MLVKVLEATDTGLWTWHVRSDAVRWSPQTFRILGIPVGEFAGTGEAFFRLVHAEDLPRVRDAVRSAVRDHRLYSEEFRVIRPDGTIRWVMNRGRASHDADGAPDTVVGTITDITDRLVRAEEQLRRQTALVEGISKGTQDLIAAQDREFRYVYFNDAYRRAFESLWNRELRVGTSMLEALAEWPEECEKARRLWGRAHAGESFSETTDFGPPGAARRTFDLRFHPVLDDAGVQIGAAHILRDVTAVHASEARLRRIIDSMFAFVGMLDPDGTLVEVNSAPLEIAGLTRADVLGRAFWDCPWWTHDAAVRERVVAAFREAAAGKVVRYDDVIRTADDSRMTIDFMLSPVFEGERLVCVIPSGVDVTARTRVEAALAQREAEFRALADHMSQFAWMADGDGSIYWYNQRWFEYTGTTLDEMHGWGWTKVHHPDHVARVVEHIRRCFQSGEPWEDMFPLRGRDGAYRWFLSRAQPIRDEGGRVVRWFGTNTDVEESRLALDALTRTAELLRAATDAAAIGIHEYDVASGRIEWDARVRELWGVPLDAPITYDVFIAGVHPDDRADVQRQVDASLDPDGAGRYEAEYRVRSRADGVERWIRATGRVTFAQRVPVRLVGTVQDVSAQKEAESRLRRVDRQKDVFLATLAHELRNPLAPIRTAAQVLANPKLASDQLAWAHGVIQRQARNMALLLDDLLDVSRITQGKLTLKRERVDLASAVDSAVETARPLLDRKRHRLTVALPPEPIVVDADPLRLAQMLSNLLTNAAKYTDPEGRIEVVACVDGPIAKVAVTDTGIGLSPETLSRLFETFSQADGSHARAEGGLGIGLALVKGLAELHGGSIAARSDGEGRGSTFELGLPLRMEAATQAPRDAVAESRRTGRRVLLADDNRDAADALAILLRMSGHEVRVGYDGRSALSLAAVFRPETAILDIGLPDMDGYAVARELRSQSWARDLVLVALTGWGQDGDRQQAAAAGFDHHLTKPVDPDELELLLASTFGLDGRA